MVEWHAFANLLKTMIGSGVLTLPYVTAQVGIPVSIIGLALIAYLTQCGIRLLIMCAAAELERDAYADLEPLSSVTSDTGLCCQSRRKNAPTARRSSAQVSEDHGGSTWTLVSGAAFGTPGRVATVVSLVTAQAGVCASYFDFIVAVVVKHAQVEGSTALLAIWLGLSLLCLVRPLRSVSWLSTAGLITYIYVLGLLAYFGLTDAPRREPLTWFRPQGLGAWFGPSLFAFEGMGTALSIYASMGSADPSAFFQVITAAYVGGFAVYCFSAVFGYAVWGGHVTQVRVRALYARHEDTTRTRSAFAPAAHADRPHATRSSTPSLCRYPTVTPPLPYCYYTVTRARWSSTPSLDRYVTATMSLHVPGGYRLLP